MKLNRYEKVSAVFVSGFVLSIVFFAVNLAIHQGWFKPKTTYSTKVDQVEGIFPGTKVQMGGLKLGRISKIETAENGEFTIHFEVFSEYKNHFREQTQVGFLRPFIIGERVLDVVPGEGDVLKEGEEVRFVQNFDFIEAFNGKRIGPYLDDMKALVDNITFLAKAFSDRKRSEDLVEIFDQLRPLMKDVGSATREVDKMAKQMTAKNNLKILVSNLATTTNAINTSLDELVSFSKQLPELGQNTNQVMNNLSELTLHLNALIPTIEAIAPTLPNASKDALHALQEALVVLKAMQKTFLLNSSVEEVREEMEKKKRELASEKEAEAEAKEESEGEDDE